jgi:GNAT superfamily N-acetyltransferase
MEARVQFRQAHKHDVEAIVAMLADDPLGAQRERFQCPLPQSYYDAFEAIESDPHNELVVATVESQIVGVLQLTFIPYLTYQGGWRALIEGVRVASEFRAQGIGRAMFQWAVHRARQRGCHLLQLTTDKARPDALRFYESLGFTASHEGMKLHLGLAQHVVQPDA